MNPQKLLLMLF